jgi:hypothetical protein
MHAQRMGTKNVIIYQILMKIFGGIGGWFFVGFGFGRHLTHN